MMKNPLWWKIICYYTKQEISKQRCLRRMLLFCYMIYMQLNMKILCNIFLQCKNWNRSTVSTVYCSSSKILFHSFKRISNTSLLNNFQKYLVFILMILSNIMMQQKYNKACDSVPIFISCILQRYRIYKYEHEHD